MAIFNNDDDEEDYGQELDDDGKVISSTQAPEKVENKIVVKNEVRKPLVSKDASKEDSSEKTDEKIQTNEGGNSSFKDKTTELSEQVKKYTEELQPLKEKTSHTHEIISIKDVQDMMHVVDEIIFAFNVSASNLDKDFKDKKHATKAMEAASLRLNNYISDIKSISDNSVSTSETLEKILDDFQGDVQNMISGMDFEPMQKAILSNINDIIKNIPLNQLNEGVGTLVTGLNNFSTVQKVFFEELKGAETKLYDVRKVIKDALDELYNVANKILKRENRFPWGIFLGAISASAIVTAIGSIYLYQDFFGNKLDEMAANFDKKVVQSQKNSGIIVKTDSSGRKYIDIDKTKAKLSAKKNSNIIRIYFREN